MRSRWHWVAALALFLMGAWVSTVSAGAMTSDRAILLAQRMLQRNPFEAGAYYRLGDAYIEKAREMGDAAYFDLAERALRKAADLAPRNSGAVRHLAYVLYSRHDFQQAAEQAARAIELDPTDGHAYGILGDAQLEVGKYAEARETYQRMIRLQADLYSLSRLAGLKSIRGDTRGAVQDLERAIRSGKADGRPKESVAWVQWQLGTDQFTLGSLREAENQFLESLKTYPNYYRALAGLGQVRVAQERYEEAIELYRRAVAILPQPDYIAALGDIFSRIGLPVEARRQYDLVEYIGHLSALNQVLYNRELALFYADHEVKLPEALALARKELEYRRDVYAYDLLAWALYKNGHDPEALAAIAEALKLGTKDARLFFHAGMIYNRMGDAAQAAAYLQRALETNPRFHIVFGETAARTLAALKCRPEVSVAEEHGHAH